MPQAATDPLLTIPMGIVCRPDASPKHILRWSEEGPRDSASWFSEKRGRPEHGGPSEAFGVTRSFKATSS